MTLKEENTFFIGCFGVCVWGGRLSRGQLILRASWVKVKEPAAGSCSWVSVQSSVSLPASFSPCFDSRTPTTCFSSGRLNPIGGSHSRVIKHQLCVLLSLGREGCLLGLGGRGLLPSGAHWRPFLGCGVSVILPVSVS